MMIDDPTNATASGLLPSSTAGSTNHTSTVHVTARPINAANPRQPATATTASANPMARRTSGRRRWRSEK